jgi:preprotein translocase subunit SecY
VALFFVIAITSLVTGAVFMMWLGEQITEKGVGNGISLLIFAGIVAGLPAAIGQSWSRRARARSTSCAADDPGAGDRRHLHDRLHRARAAPHHRELCQAAAGPARCTRRRARTCR